MEYKLTQIYRKSNKVEDRMDKAEAEKDMEKYAKLDCKNNILVNQISLMHDVLLCLGYSATFDYDENRAILTKR